MDEVRERFMEAFALLDDAQQRRLVFLARLLAHCKPIEPSGEGGGSPAYPPPFVFPQSAD